MVEAAAGGMRFMRVGAFVLPHLGGRVPRTSICPRTFIGSDRFAERDCDV